MAILPEDIPTGKVTGQYYFVNEDTIEDPDQYPQLTVVTGFVRFKASIKVLRMSARKAVVIPLTFDAKFNSEGKLVPADHLDSPEGILLPATDSTEFDTTGWTWTATFEIKDAVTGHTIQIDPITFQVPVGSERDLSTIVPAPASPGVITTRGPQGAKGDKGDTGDTGPSPTDPLVAGYLTDPESESRSALSSAIGESVKPNLEVIPNGTISPNVYLGGKHNGADILSTVSGGVLLNPGGTGYNNVIGGDGTSTVDTVTPNVTKSGIIANQSVLGGYDNVAGQLSSKIISDHSYTEPPPVGETAKGHNSIYGGANHTLGWRAGFSAIGGGYENRLIAGDYCAIVGGYNNEVNVPGGGNVTVGGRDNEVTGSAGTAFGGYNEVTGSGGFAAGMENIVGSGVALGRKNNATGDDALATGNSNTASGAHSTVQGIQNTASANYAVAQGNQNTASGTGSRAEGVLNQATADYTEASGLQAKASILGQRARSSGAFAVPGDAQTSELIQKATTTTAAVGYFRNSYALNPGQTVQYRAMVTARDTTTGDSKAWTLQGAVKRVGASSPAPVGGSLPVASTVVADTAAAPWTITPTISGNTLVFVVTGEAGKTVRWVARTELVEVSA